MTRVALVTLGCEKNTVDSERYLAQLQAYGAHAVADPSDAEVIVINTCGFIDAAKKESLDAIVAAGHLRESGSCRAVVAVGCLIERHRSELAAALPEVDLFLGASEMERLVPELRSRGFMTEDVVLHPGVRSFTGTLPHLRHLKASEGCDHGCAFCAIPLMRGRHRSFDAADIVHEARLLELQGAREVNLVAQDLAHYGRDRRDGSDLRTLLQEIVSGTTIPWIRLLYLYSAGITPVLMEYMAGEERVLSYLDMPMQHASDRILAAMRRPERRESIREKVLLARSIIPDVAIRTTCIVGFPGESDDDVSILLEFLDEMRFDGLACFAYSPQEGTRAWEMRDDVPATLKRERMERVTELQRHLASESERVNPGDLFIAMVDGVEDGITTGRAWWQAHDIDGVTLLDGSHQAGAMVSAECVSRENDFDIRATVLDTLSPARAAYRAPREARHLPLMLSSTGSYGR